jgi:hypothetical protein
VFLFLFLLSVTILFFMAAELIVRGSIVDFGVHRLSLFSSLLQLFKVEIVKMIEKLDCVLSKRATRRYIYGHTRANAYVLIYV